MTTPSPNLRGGGKKDGDEGYKFNVAVYSEYYDNKHFKLIGYKPMNNTSFTADQDCFIRISVGTSGDDILWEEDAAGVITFTADGEAAKSGINLNLVGTDIKQRIEALENDIRNVSNVHVLEL